MTTKTNTKNNLSICLTESVVFLRSSNFTGRRHSASDSPSAVLRGLLTLNLAKPTRISSIEIEFQGKSSTNWPEGEYDKLFVLYNGCSYLAGVGARRTELAEEHKIFSASQIFFRAPSTPSSSVRRALSVGPGLAFYRDELEHVDIPLEHERTIDSSPDVPSRQNSTTESAPEGDMPIRRGRDTARRRLSADRTVFQRDPVINRTNSRSPTPLYTMPYVTPHSRSSSVAEPGYYTPRSARSSMSHFSPMHRMDEIPSDLEIGARDSARSVSRQPSGSSTMPSASSPSFRSNQDTSISRRASIDEDPHLHTVGTSSPVRGRDPSVEDPPGRKISHFSLSAVSNVILDAVKERVRSNSPKALDRANSVDKRDASRGRILDKGKEKELTPTWGRTKERTGSTLGRVGEAFGLEAEEHKEFGDGWREFKKGTYTFPISFSIPSDMPPSLECDYGSVTWRLKAQVHRPGTFTAKLTATRDVIVVASPSDDDTEDTENIVVERFWDDQLQYLLSISGRMFNIGGSIPIQMSFLPMSKMKIHRLSVILEERVDYYVQMKRSARSEQTHRFSLLSIKYPNKDAPPILPLESDDPSAFMNSPLYALLGPDDDPSEMASSLMGPGPWSFQTAVKLPSACGLLHFTNKNKKSNVQIQHMLKIAIRVERGDDMHIDAKTGKRKMFDIVVQTPVHILSCLCNPEFTSLPRYSENLEDTIPQARSCTCAVKRRRQSILSSAPPPVMHSSGLEHISSRHSTDSGASVAEVTIAPLSHVGSLYDRNFIIYERLITGQQSERGEAPPAYDTVPRRTVVI
ncbi:hypothetical protein EW146_g6579 [Bondarzewia mesenterica]|uniref:Arrestin C-terminal-like domain-containing protein n=1 Tax=Bondarzewia mesenterica TaxID=1095465 RepID=A0A4S4LTT7_9AGAM|nr:hypothetical protein EW146_g6579 [Bondarzewia mesenterica]